ncbi:MAG: IS1380 family transposase [Actinobacteria bacterium]|nr:IS1380 family transposase [Actinomycetota bacterium]
MVTECNIDKLELQEYNEKKVIADFNGGKITSDGGGILLREVENRFKIIKDFSKCFTDYRNEEKIEHTMEELLAQRIFAIALGYEDINDHDRIRNDNLLAMLVGKKDPTGKDRKRDRDNGKALAGSSTLNRLEFIPEQGAEENRYKKITADFEKIEDFFINKFIECEKTVPKEIILDFDATDDPLHGNQEGKFFHGYYMNYCYLPLYVFCGEQLLVAKLRNSNIDASAGTVEILKKIIPIIRKSWTEVRIIIRGDSGFCREEIMKWCEENKVDYIFGLAKNSRLVEFIKEELDKACEEHKSTGKPARIYKEFLYATLRTWSCERRVVGKAEYLSKGSNPRFVVSSISSDEYDSAKLYENLYCARGEMENRIKEQQLDLFADRTSTSLMRSNQLRLWFSSVAYMLISMLRRIGLKGTEMETAQCGTIRVRLLKIGALLKFSVRRILLMFAEGFPLVKTFEKALNNLRLIPIQLE